MFQNITLHHYWRSSCSWRVRWVLAHKGLKPTYIPVGLVDGQNESPDYLLINPTGYVPVLTVAGRHLVESTAILEFLEELVPTPSLLPGDAFDRHHVRALCEVVNSGIQPLHNLSVNEHLSADPAVRTAWNQHWIRKGLAAFQRLAAPRSGRFTFGDRLTAADIYLVPQCYAAARFGIDIQKELPLLSRWSSEALATPEGQASHPDRFKP